MFYSEVSQRWRSNLKMQFSEVGRQSECLSHAITKEVVAFAFSEL
jgi:hypothetical protein